MTAGGASGDNSGITAGGSVTQTAGRDAAGRDMIRSAISVALAFGGGPQVWETPEGRERSGRFTANLSKRLSREYSDRLQQALVDTSLDLHPQIRTVPEAVAAPLAFLPGRPLGDALEPGTTPAHLIEDGGRLLVLGGPGAGKTTLLLEMSLEMLVPESTDGPLPLIVPLSGWQSRPRLDRRGKLSRQFHRWLAATLATLYQVPDEALPQWITERRVLLLLDGLDEITDLGERVACLTAIDRYVTERSAWCVLTCRESEYQALGVRPHFDNAIFVGPLRPEQVLDHLRRAGRHAGLIDELETDPAKLSALTSPLLLNIVLSTSRGTADGAPLMIGGIDDVLARYVEQCFDSVAPRPDGSSASTTRGRSLRWLSHLARGMNEASQTVYLLEGVSGRWLPRGLRLLGYVPTAVLAAIVTIIPIQRTLSPPRVLGAAVTTLAFLAFSVSASAHPLAMRWSLSAVRGKLSRLAWLTGVGASYGLLLTVFRVASSITSLTLWPLGLTADKRLVGTLVGAATGSVVGLLVLSFEPRPIQSRRSPFDSLRESAVAGLQAFTVGWLITVVLAVAVPKVAGSEQYLSPAMRYLFLNVGSPALNQALHLAMFVGLLLGTLLGWGFLVANCWLRLLLALSGHAPLRMVRWLNSMVDARLLHRSGAGFVFMHRTLQDFFSARAGGAVTSLPSSAVAAPPSTQDSPAP